MLLGYNTNGFAHHDLSAAIEILAGIGYRSVAITLDHAALNPFDAGLAGRILEIRQQLERHRMRSVVETGARFLLDPWRKHEPTLMSRQPEARRRRGEFLCRAIAVAADLGSDCVSLWSGTLGEPLADSEAWRRLCTALQPVLEAAEARGVVLGFEPEPGMFVATMRDFEQLRQHIVSPRLQLTLDIGHLHCQGETPIATQIRRWAPALVNVHLEDMRCGVHEHLLFGDGEIDFPPIIEALAEVNYSGGLHVELSRHSHIAPQTARRAFDFLHPLVAATGSGRR
jgi:sugar phosphate isomerase/epimerase